jgi:hypothetical protein
MPEVEGEKDKTKIIIRKKKCEKKKKTNEIKTKNYTSRLVFSITRCNHWRSQVRVDYCVVAVTIGHVRLETIVMW